MRYIIGGLSCLLFVLSLLPLGLAAQEVAYEDFLSILNDFYKKQQSSQANNYAKEVLKQYEKTWAEHSLEQYNKLIALAQQTIGDRNATVAYLIHKKGIYLYRKRAYAEALPVFKQSLKTRQNIYKDGHPDLANSAYTIGVLYLKLEDYQQAIAYFKQALAVYEKINDSRGIAKCCEQLGSTYEEIKDYKLAEGYILLAINHLMDAYGYTHSKLASAFNNLGLVQLRQKQYPIAIKSFQQAIAIHQFNETQSSRSLSNYSLNMAHAYHEMGKRKEALNHYSKVLELEKIDDSESSINTFNALLNIGIYHQDNRNFDKARGYMQQALQICKDIFGNEKNIQYNYAYHNIGTNYFRQKDYPQALVYFQKAIQQQIQNFDKEDIYANPYLPKAEWLGTKTELLLDFDFKAQAFFQWYQQSKDLQYLQAAYDTYLIATELIDLMRTEFVAHGSKLFWLEETYPIFERAIECSLLLYKQTNKPQYQQQVFTLMEKNKAVLLMESLQLSQEQTYAQIPNSLLQEQNQLQEAIVAQKRKIIELEQAGVVTDSLIRVYKNELFRLQIESYNFEDKLEKEYASEREQAAHTSIASVTELQQQLLSDQQALIEYFWGDSSIYIATITKRQFEIDRFPKRGLSQKLELLRDALTAPQNRDFDAAAVFQQYTQTAYFLYQQLIQAARQYFSKDINELIIIADGDLAGIPFDILLAQQAPEKVFYAPDYLSYLLNDFAITYHHSASLLIHRQERTSTPTSHYFTAFAPTFNGKSDRRTASRSCSSENLSQLLNNETEVQQIASLFDSQVFLAQNATKANFMQQAGDCRILHLATHACMDNQTPSQSRIYFTDDYLYVHELYHLPLQADMVVLSACETGIGEYQRGEGIMSLARGFAWSGTPSITMSLWSVNDETTAQLMPLYYQHLQTGINKHIALQRAKIDFLKKQEVKSKLHPIYWAAFVHLGEVKGLEITGGKLIWKWVLVLGGLGFLLWVWGGRK